MVGEQAIDLVLFAEEVAHLSALSFLRTRYSAAPRFGAVADQNGLAAFWREVGKDFDDVGDALYGTKLERCMTMGSPLGAHLARGPRSALPT